MLLHSTGMNYIWLLFVRSGFTHPLTWFWLYRETGTIGLHRKPRYNDESVMAAQPGNAVKGAEALRECCNDTDIDSIKDLSAIW